MFQSRPIAFSPGKTSGGRVVPLSKNYFHFVPVLFIILKVLSFFSELGGRAFRHFERKTNAQVICNPRLSNEPSDCIIPAFNICNNHFKITYNLLLLGRSTLESRGWFISR